MGTALYLYTEKQIGIMIGMLKKAGKTFSSAKAEAIIAKKTSCTIN